MYANRAHKHEVLRGRIQYTQTRHWGVQCFELMCDVCNRTRARGVAESRTTYADPALEQAVLRGKARRPPTAHGVRKECTWVGYKGACAVKLQCIRARCEAAYDVGTQHMQVWRGVEYAHKQHSRADVRLG
jgi:hypothetical protein